MTEKRAVTRKRTFLKGVLSFNNGNSSEDCLVRDLTEEGAQIELPHPYAPEACELLVPTRNVRVRARAVWRNGKRRGLRFEETPAEAPPRPKAPPPPVEDDGY